MEGNERVALLRNEQVALLRNERVALLRNGGRAQGTEGSGEERRRTQGGEWWRWGEAAFRWERQAAESIRE